jgi:hypothetical protein
VIRVELPSASSSAIATVAALPAAQGDRLCGWCRRSPIRATARRDGGLLVAALHQAPIGRLIRRAELDATARPLRLAYADPPYPGLARRYYRDHPDFAGEVDLDELLSRLQRYDGWALSTSVRALPMVLARCVAQGLEVRVAAWFRGARPHATARIVTAWEPVVYAGGRRIGLAGPTVTDALVGVVPRRRTTLPTAVIGAKPPEFCRWVFDLLGAGRGDTLDDLYPGSGMVSWAWECYQGRDPSRGSASDDSEPSCAPGRDRRSRHCATCSGRSQGRDRMFPECFGRRPGRNLPECPNVPFVCSAITMCGQLS